MSYSNTYTQLSNDEINDEEIVFDRIIELLPLDNGRYLRPGQNGSAQSGSGIGTSCVVVEPTPRGRHWHTRFVRALDRAGPLFRRRIGNIPLYVLGVLFGAIVAVVLFISRSTERREDHPSPPVAGAPPPRQHSAVPDVGLEHPNIDGEEESECRVDDIRPEERQSCYRPELHIFKPV